MFVDIKDLFAFYSFSDINIFTFLKTLGHSLSFFQELKAGLQQTFGL